MLKANSDSVSAIPKASLTGGCSAIFCIHVFSKKSCSGFYVNALWHQVMFDDPCQKALAQQPVSSAGSAISAVVVLF